MNIYATLNQLKFYAIDKVGVGYMQSEYRNVYILVSTVQGKKKTSDS